MRPEPFGIGTKVLQISLAFIRDLEDLLSIGSPIRYQMDSPVRVIHF